MVNQDDNIAEQVIAMHAEGKGGLEIARTFKNCLNIVSSMQKQISDRGAPETSTEQWPENADQ